MLNYHWKNSESSFVAVPVQYATKQVETQSLLWQENGVYPAVPRHQTSTLPPQFPKHWNLALQKGKLEPFSLTFGFLGTGSVLLCFHRREISLAPPRPFTNGGTLSCIQVLLWKCAFKDWWELGRGIRVRSTFHVPIPPWISYRITKNFCID